MEKKKNKGVIILLIIIIVCLIGYIICDKVLLSQNSIESDNKNREVINNEENTIESIDANKYVELVNYDLKGNNIKKVTFTNLDDSLTKDFLDKQDKLINDIQGEYSKVESDVWYQVNKDILSVYYKLTTSYEIGDCASIATLNIDLVNNKILSNEDILKLGNTSFNKIATDEYDRSLKFLEDRCEKNNTCFYEKKMDNGQYGKLTLEEFKTNKEEIINKIETGLDNIIYPYIKDGSIKYDYRIIDLHLLYMAVNKGGCFPYMTEEIGKY